MTPPKEFWIINISNVNVMLADLCFNIPKGCYYNLLDAKHFHYTWDQIEKSAESGSLFKKSDKVKHVPEKPNFGKKLRSEMSTIPAERKIRTVVKVEVVNYDAILFSDEQYAQEISEIFDEEKKKT